MSQIYIRPKAGLTPRLDGNRVLHEEGALVAGTSGRPADKHIRRLLRDGDVVVAPVPKAFERIRADAEARRREAAEQDRIAARARFAATTEKVAADVGAGEAEVMAVTSNKGEPDE